MSGTADPERMGLELEAIQQRLRRVESQSMSLEADLQETRRALSTLESLTADQDALVPIGGGLHVRARLHGDAPIVVPIGAGYAADQDLDAAKATLQERLEATTRFLQETEAEADRLAQQGQALMARLRPSS